jgi:hypothetical protein
MIDAADAEFYSRVTATSAVFCSGRFDDSIFATVNGSELCLLLFGIDAILSSILVLGLHTAELLNAGRGRKYSLGRVAGGDIGHKVKVRAS